MNEDISMIFALRDRAVRKQNKELFFSTQVGELDHGASIGYFELEYLTTEVLHVHMESEIEAIAVVKEKFGHYEDDYHHEILVYHLILTVQGWKIYRMH